jgi:CubicO group peptidase (beta-lactamase class C family)
MDVRLEKASRLLDELYETGHYPALQVCVRHRGEIVLHRALGSYRPIGEEDRWIEATEQTRFMLFSLSKCVTAVAIHLLLERGLVRVDDPVHWHIPEFAEHGKEHITIRHILTHSAGIPMLTWRFTDELIRDWDAIIDELCRSRPLYFPGRFTSYHLFSGGYLLGEIVRRVDGRELRAFVAEEILEPLGFETFNYGVAPEWYPLVASSERVESLPPRPVIELINHIVQLDIEQALAVMNRPAVFESVIPSGNIVGTAEELSRFFQMLLDGGRLGSTRVLSKKQVHRATLEQYVERDWVLFGTRQRYSLGFMLGRKRTPLNIFGRKTERAFGHIGFSRNLGWADPAVDAAVGFLTSSKITYPRREALLLRRFQNAVREALSRPA